MQLINEQEIVENGYTFVERTYDTGTVEKIMKVEPVEVESVPEIIQPTNAEIQENQLIIMEALADLFTAVSGV